MNPEIKEKWIAALESGEYKHTKEALKKLDIEGKVVGYCCLGVLADLYTKETGKGGWQKDAFLGTSGSNEFALLPSCVQEWSGVDSHGHFKGYSGALTMINDAPATTDFTPVIAAIKEHF